MLAAGAVMGVAAWLVDRRRRSYADLATTPAAAVFAGRNEVKGRAWAAAPLVSHRRQVASIWWAYCLEEERRHTRTVTSTDSQGHTHTRTEHYTQWHVIDRKHQELPWFEVVDDTGSVPVRLDGARVEPRQVFTDTFRGDEHRGFLESMFSNRTGRYRETEQALAVGDQLFVVGEAELDEPTCVPVLGRQVLVTTRSEESRTRGLAMGVAVLLVLALAGVVFGSTSLLAPDRPERPTAWLPGVVGSALVLTIAWSITVYNRLRLLAESTERAWTLIDVQLQRRHDLIPALAKTVTAQATHEAAALTQRARQGAAGPPEPAEPTDRAEPAEPAEAAGDDGWQAGEARRTSDLTGEATAQTTRLRRILGVAEAHPQLITDAAFLGLQRELADTESRIAGSRTFYNDTLLLLRNQMQRFPGVLVASRLRLAHRDPIGAEGFERTVPAVERSFA
ncbi:MAG TPA: LemA family protein [Acidimicrobiales bacterium]|nr:LemA family protein [Acidimicrobiales bacterium]